MKGFSFKIIMKTFYLDSICKEILRILNVFYK